ncbi:MAG: hypothetical protein WDM77_06425 [Steroidobacteraceae bacterium]
MNEQLKEIERRALDAELERTGTRPTLRRSVFDAMTPEEKLHFVVERRGALTDDPKKPK